MAIRISGMNSGLDTDSIVQALVMDVKTKKESYEKKKTKLEWTQEIWKGINSNVYSLYNKVNNMRWSSAYNLKKTTVSDATKASVTASNTAVTGTQKLNILSVAQSGYLTGGKLSTTANTGTTLAELGYSGGDATINVDKGDGTSASITVSASTTIAELTEALGKQGLNASLDTTNNRIFVSSKQTGIKNDFNLIAGDENGLKALKSLGLTTSIGDGTATQATYTKYGTYAMTAEGTIITDENEIRENIENALKAYTDASKSYEDVTAQIANLKLAAQSYGSAYTAVQDFYATYQSESISKTNSVFQSIVLMSSAARNNTLVDTADGTEYTMISKKDSDGNTVYSTKDAEGNVSYVKKIETYTDADDNIYTKKDNGSYVRTDAEGNEITYSGDTAELTKHVAYHQATEKITGKSEEKDEEGNAISYEVNSRIVDDTTQYYITTADGTEYTSDALTGEFKNGDEVIKIGEVSYDYISGAQNNTIKGATELYDGYRDEIISKLDQEGKTEAELKASAESILSVFSGNLATVNSIEKQAEEEKKSEKVPSANDLSSLIEKIQDAYSTGATVGDGTAAVETVTNGYITNLTSLVENQTKQKTIMDANDAVSSLAGLEGQEYATALNKMIQTAKTGATVLNDKTYTASAVKIDGSDAEIKLNGVKYTSDTNSITVNGITVTAMGITGDGDENAITINTQTDAQGIYDKIKDFFTEYNKVINELCKQYNAEYVKDYEPLTEDEKEEMSDKEIEKWEEKIKGSLLRHDSTVSSVINAMTGAMFKTVDVNGKTYSLANFGIQTLGYLNAAKNEHYAYHIDGDEDDDVTSGKDDKLMAMINSDPDTVVDFFKQLSTNLYQALDTKMKSTSMNSAYTIYSDKQMTKDLDSYTKLIKTWEEKLEDREEYYYKKFSAMEKAMASLNSTQSSLSGYFQ